MPKRAEAERQTLIRRVAKDSHDGVFILNRLMQNIPVLLHEEYKDQPRGKDRAADYSDDVRRDLENALFHLTRWEKRAAEKLAEEAIPAKFPRSTRKSEIDNSAEPAPLLWDQYDTQAEANQLTEWNIKL